MNDLRVISFAGRINRETYSVAIYAFCALTIGLHLIVPYLELAGWIAIAGLFVLSALVMISLTARRLHDLDLSTRNIAWNILPLIEAAMIIALSGRFRVDPLATIPATLFWAATIALAIWGVAGTSYIMWSQGSAGINRFGVRPPQELPNALSTGEAPACGDDDESSRANDS